LPVQVPELYILTREELEIHFCGWYKIVTSENETSEH
jgi:hypothetical protein